MTAKTQRNEELNALKKYMDIPLDIERLSKEIVDSAFQVHKTMGPGLTERIYEDCFVCELRDRNIAFERQKPTKVQYKHHNISTEYRIDLLIEGKIIVELKTVEQVLPVHRAQVMSYMKLTRVPLGLLINFNVPLIKDGIKRIVIS